MSELFASLDPDRGKRRGLWARRTLVAAFAAVAALALWGAFGQRDSESVAHGAAAALTVAAPATVRGGLYFQATVEVTARARIGEPRLIFDEGWLEGMQVSSIEPMASDEASRDGRLALAYGSLEPGERLKLWLQFQVNPTSVGARPHGVELADGDRTLARVERDLVVMP
jgi:hypothetical protein